MAHLNSDTIYLRITICSIVQNYYSRVTLADHQTLHSTGMFECMRKTGRTISYDETLAELWLNNSVPNQFPKYENINNK